MLQSIASFDAHQLMNTNTRPTGYVMLHRHETHSGWAAADPRSECDYEMLPEYTVDWYRNVV